MKVLTAPRLAVALGALALLLLVSLVVGPADAPVVAPTAAQLLPPGVRVDEIALAAGETSDRVGQRIPAVLPRRLEQGIELSACIRALDELHRLADECRVGLDDLLIAVGYLHACGS